MSIIAQVVVPNVGIHFIGRRAKLTQDIAQATRFDSIDDAQQTVAWVREIMENPLGRDDVKIRFFANA